MRIENLRLEKNHQKVRAAATVLWEDCDRPTHQVYFETDEAFADGLSCNPHAFLLSSAIPAMYYGEERICLDAPVCPELRQNLTTAMKWLRHWFYDPDRPLVRIEAPTRSSLPTPRTPERAGFFFSGGVDSFATLLSNRLDYPSRHPHWFRDGLLVYGLELDSRESFRHVLNSLSQVAPELGITLIPVYTNLYLNYRQEDAENHYSFWTYQFQGAAFAALAHLFSRRFTVMSIASTDDIPNIYPFGTHPLLDPNYSSSDLRIRLDGTALSRFKKTKRVAEWDAALRHLRVCNQYKRYRAGRLNCGRCEKCVRTMLALEALGVLDRTSAFPTQTVSTEMIESSVQIDDDLRHYYQELIAPLSKRGRHDLVQAIQRKMVDNPVDKPGLKARIRHFDRHHLNGTLRKWLASSFSKRNGEKI